MYVADIQVSQYIAYIILGAAFVVSSLRQIAPTGSWLVGCVGAESGPHSWSQLHFGERRMQRQCFYWRTIIKVILQRMSLS